MSAFNLNKGNQTAQNRLKLQKERTEIEELAMPDARRVPLSRLRPNPFQVRQDFDSPAALQALQELADDIRKRDLLEPLVVRPIEENGEELYQIIAGERRFRAARLAGKTHVPVIVRDNWTDSDARMASLAENLQRRDLTLVEEVHFFLELENTSNLAAAQIARLINKSESYVSKRLRLAHNPQRLKELSERNLGLTEALLGSDDPTLDDGPVVERVGPKQTAARQSAQNLRLVPFVRFRDVLEKTSRQLEQKELAGDERDQLLEELSQIEQDLSALKKTLNKRTK